MVGILRGLDTAKITRSINCGGDLLPVQAGAVELFSYNSTAQ